MDRQVPVAGQFVKLRSQGRFSNRYEANQESFHRHSKSVIEEASEVVRKHQAPQADEGGDTNTKLCNEENRERAVTASAEARKG